MVFGLGWWVHPGPAAEMLGATLLEGTGRTAQIGDTGAFFVGAGIDAGVGSHQRSGQRPISGRIIGRIGGAGSSGLCHVPRRQLDTR